MSNNRLSYNSRLKFLRLVVVSVLFLVFSGFPQLPTAGTQPDIDNGQFPRVSDHFNGATYFNPESITSVVKYAQNRSRARWWASRLMFGSGYPQWPNNEEDMPPGPVPEERIAEGALRITPVGHATFLIQMDGMNILTDPIWADRCSPVSWVGPKRYKKPGIAFKDLPPIDFVLISHNHYDHLDLPTLESLADRGTFSAIGPLGNKQLIESSGISQVRELDWWQSVRISDKVTVTFVPARHLSQRTLWDRNKTLWGGYVVSGPSGNVYFAGDTAYGAHFKQIAARFSPIRVALLPIAPFQPKPTREPPSIGNHIGPVEAVIAHMDLNPEVSIAGHYQVFQFGSDGYYDAVKLLAESLKENSLSPDAFVVLDPGRPMDLDQQTYLSEKRNL
ncbi:MAG TPA: MBL fold metallo-hydrolase [Syntrophorhabdaceae bacterium]|nr:MBL fold metallo-hydrolase [Syntrophorhabdaceae bacterium]